MRRVRAAWLLLAVCTTLAACFSNSKDAGKPVSSTPQPATTASLVGTWKLTAFQVDGQTRDVSSDGIATLTFGEGGRLSADDLTNAITGHYAVFGKTLTVRDTVSTAAAPPSSGSRRNASDAIDVVYLDETTKPSIALSTAADRDLLTVTRGDRSIKLTR